MQPLLCPQWALPYYPPAAALAGSTALTNPTSRLAGGRAFPSAHVRATALGAGGVAFGAAATSPVVSTGVTLRSEHMLILATISMHPPN